MQNDAQTRALEVCLQTMQAGEKLDQVLELYPQWAADLTQPLEAAQVLRVYAGSLQIPAQTQELQRTGYLETAQQLARESSFNTSTRSWAIRLAWLALILGIGVVFIWVYAAASVALPGETLYPLKQAAWQIRLQTTRDAVQKLDISRKVDQIRLKEISSLIALDRVVDVNFVGLLEENPTGAWKVSGIPIDLLKQAQVLGKVKKGIWVEVEGTLQADGSVQVERIRPHELVIEGVLEDLTSDTLTIAGIPVQFGKDTLVHGSPLIGSEVEVIVFRTSDDRLLARLVDANLVP